MIKQYYSISELLELKIPGFPQSTWGLQKKAEREHWTSKERNKLGGGREYSVDSLPDDAKNFILSQKNSLLERNS